MTLLGFSLSPPTSAVQGGAGNGTLTLPRIVTGGGGTEGGSGPPAMILGTGSTSTLFLASLDSTRTDGSDVTFGEPGDPPILPPPDNTNPPRVGLPPSNDLGNFTITSPTSTAPTTIKISLLEQRPDFDFHQPTLAFQKKSTHATGQKGLGMSPGIASATPRYVPIGEF